MQLEPSHSIHLKAVIYIGASSVSMLLTTEEGNKEVDFLEQSIPLGHDIFNKGRISKISISRAVRIISGYLKNIEEYGPQKPENLKIAASNILDESDNKENFITRIQVFCGLPIHILDDGEMTRLLYLKTKRRLKDTPVMQKKTTLVLHVGPGNTRAILFKQGRIINYKSYRLGAFRTEEAIQSLDLSGNDLLRVIKEHSGGQILALAADFKDLLIQEVVMIGFEIQSLTSSFAKKNSTKIPTQSLQDLCEKFSKYSIDQIVKNYPFDYQAAEAVLPALEINVTIAQSLGIKSIRIPGSDYERGLLTDISNDMGFSSGFEEEVIQSAIQLAQKFQVNIEHASNVCLLCEMFFQKLEHIHHLSSHDLLLLRAAAILHESGGFIQSRAHHKHSLYLISNSEIFGLSQHDVNLIALIARYHRNSGPKPNHTLYRDLSSSEKIRITKLASLLRVADALDRSHLGRIQRAEIHIKKRKLIISLKGISDASVERLAMRSKGDLFQDIFGLEIIIEESSN